MWTLNSADPSHSTVAQKLQTMAIESAGPSHSTSEEELRNFRLEGNRLFAGKDWVVEKYSECINMGLPKLEKNGSTSLSEEENLKCLLTLAYSNRAQAWLQLRHWEDALRDAEKALEFEPKHVKTLVRQGKAAHGLGFYEKSFTAFKAALELSPQDQFIENALAMSTTALHQSLTGEYDLLNYYFGVEEDPACADFVGPVEIRRVSYGLGRRGLFATRRVQAGDVLVVSNPLAVVSSPRSGSECKLTDAEEVDTPKEQFDSLMEQLRKKVTTSTHLKVQLCSLARHQQGESEIPSIELFRPGSAWLPPGAENLEVDCNLIQDIFFCNFMSWASLGGSKGDSYRTFTGIWVLPSFVNHSCAPNCQRSYVGKAIFLPASRDIQEGEELTVSYIEDLCSGVESRQASTLRWFFKCGCSRCLVEESFNKKLLPKLSKTKTTPLSIYHILPDSPVSDDTKSRMKWGADKLSRIRVVNVVEEMLKSCASQLGPKEQSWIRASFMSYYADNLEFLEQTTRGASKGKIEWLNLMLDSKTSVCAGDSCTLEFADQLLEEVKQMYTKNSKSYRRTLDQVLSLYRIHYGNLPERILHKLIKKKSSVLRHNMTHMTPTSDLTPDDIESIATHFNISV